MTATEITELRTRREHLQAARDRLISIISGDAVPLDQALLHPADLRRRIGEIEEHIAVIDRLIKRGVRS